MNRKLLIAGLIILIAFACKRQKPEEYDYYEPYNKDSLKVQEADSIAVVDTSSEDETVATIEKEETVAAVDLNDNFFLVIASYSVQDFAVAQKNELMEQGYKPEIFMVDDDGWFKLAIESYETFDEAKTALKRVQKDGEFSSVRIVSRKSK